MEIAVNHESEAPREDVIIPTPQLSQDNKSIRRVERPLPEPDSELISSLPIPYQSRDAVCM
jgi:hypothetical protein